MGIDLRTQRTEDSYVRFLIYKADTQTHEILEHSATPKGAFRGTIEAESYTEAEIGGLVKTYVKTGTIETTDNIKLNVSDVIYNTHSKELYIVESLDGVKSKKNLQFSTRPITTRVIRVRGGLNG